MNHAIGLLELNSLAAGVLAADTMVKTAAVDLLQATIMCPGKYIILVAGDVSAVQSAVAAGQAGFAANIISSLVLANVHPDVFPALRGAVAATEMGALGLIESFSVAAAIQAADAAAKAAVVQLLEIRLARGIGGKAFVLFTGDVGAVTVAVAAGARQAEAEGMLAGTAVIANPDAQVWEQVL